MRQQLRARVVLPVALLGLLGAGFGAFAYDQPPADDTSSYVTTHTDKTASAKKKAPAGKKAAAKKPTRAALEGALREHRAVVVVLFTPDGGVDNAAVREARAGAAAVDAGFIAVNVKRNAAVAKYFERYEVREAPAVLVFLRGPTLSSHFDGYADRGTVAQAVANALR